MLNQDDMDTVDEKMSPLSWLCLKKRGCSSQRAEAMKEGCRGKLGRSESSVSQNTHSGSATLIL